MLQLQAARVMMPMARSSRQRSTAAISGRLRAVGGGVGLLLWLLCAPYARAQQAPAERLLTRDDSEARRTTMARAIFEEGLRFVDAGQWVEAQDRFARVLELRYSAVAAYNLGLAQARLGHGVVASATLRKLLADPALETKVHDPALALLSDVEAHFGWLTLRVAGRCDGCQVHVDREEWPSAVLGVAVPIDPGAHALELRWAASVLASDRVEVQAAARVEATLAAPSGDPSAGRNPTAVDIGLAPKAAPASGSSAGTPLLTNPWFWGAMGVLVAGAVTVLIVETR